MTFNLPLMPVVLSKQTQGLAIALLGALLMSFDPIFIKSSGVDGLDAAFLFGFFMAISMFSLMKFTNRNAPISTVSVLKNNGWPLLVSSCLMVVSAGALVISLKYTSVANTFLILCSAPAITALTSRLMLGEKTSPTTWLVIFIVMGGVLIVVSGSLKTANLTGDLLAFISVVSLSINQTLLRKYKQVSRVVTIGLGGFLLAISMMSFVTPSEYSLDTWVIMAGLGLFTGPLGRVLSQVATRYITATEVGVVLMLEAALAPLLAFVFFNEVPAMRSIIGGVIIFFSILYFITSVSRNTSKEKNV